MAYYKKKIGNQKEADNYNSQISAYLTNPEI